MVNEVDTETEDTTAISSPVENKQKFDAKAQQVMEAQHQLIVDNMTHALKSPRDLEEIPLKRVGNRRASIGEIPSSAAANQKFNALDVN